HMLLSFSCSCHPPYLHSFPTRRSSDLLLLLSLAMRTLACTLSRNPAARSATHPPTSAGRPLQPRTQAILLQASVQSTRLVTHSSDRKSTRLNSSHRTISYAVFCLKKKT